MPGAPSLDAFEAHSMEPHVFKVPSLLILTDYSHVCAIFSGTIEESFLVKSNLFKLLNMFLVLIDLL
jgi:hypothetical protein